MAAQPSVVSGLYFECAFYGDVTSASQHCLKILNGANSEILCILKNALIEKMLNISQISSTKYL